MYSTYCLQVSDHDVLLIELGSGLSFPATEYLSNVIHTQALQGNDLLSLLGYMALPMNRYTYSQHSPVTKLAKQIKRFMLMIYQNLK